MFLIKNVSHGVEAAIAAAEQHSSVENRVVTVRHCWGDICDKVQSLFHQTRRDQTERRIAVWIMRVVGNHESLVYGYRGICQKVGPKF